MVSCGILIVRAAALAALSGGVLHAAPVAIFSNFVTSPTSAAPGGGTFQTGTTSTIAFDRPFLSPDGSRWIINTIVEAGTNDLDNAVTGTGSTGAGATSVAREATTAIPGELASLIVAIDTQMGITNAGSFAFSADTSAATTADQVVFNGSGVGLGVVAREGQPAPNGSSAQNFGTSLNAAHIESSGQVNFRATMTPTTTNQRLYAGSTVESETDVTSPAGQLTAPSQTVDALTSDRFVSSADGSVRMYHGDLNGATATDLVMVRNNTVLAQEGSVLPGSGFVSTVLNLSGDAGSQQLSPNGSHYMFRGGNADAREWVYRDGAVVAVTDQPIHIGATDLWDDTAFTTTFFINTTNDLGDYIIGGLSNAGDVNKDAVLVFNNSFVFLREGDPVDLDGNGLLDDNTFIDVFGNDDFVLTNDLQVYFVAALQDANGVAVGSAFLHTTVPEPATISAVLIGAAALVRRRQR